MSHIHVLLHDPSIAVVTSDLMDMLEHLVLGKGYLDIMHILVGILLLIPGWALSLAVLIYLTSMTRFICSSCSSLKSLHNSLLLTVTYFCIGAFQSDWEELHSWNGEMALGAGISAPTTERKVQVKPFALCLTHLLSLGIPAHRVSITHMWPTVCWHKRILRPVLALTLKFHAVAGGQKNLNVVQTKAFRDCCNKLGYQLSSSGRPGFLSFYRLTNKDIW